MKNPFKTIDVRLSRIENLLLDLKHQPRKVEPAEQPERLLTVQEAAQFLNLSLPTIYSKVSKGELPVLKGTKHLYFSQSELLKSLEEERKNPNAHVQEFTKKIITLTLKILSQLIEQFESGL